MNGTASVGETAPLLSLEHSSDENFDPDRLIFFNVLKDCNKVAGEENINEFLPYTLLSVANKIFYSVLFIIYFSSVQNHGGDSANGVTYKSNEINIINSFSIIVTGLALMILSGLSGRNTWNFRRIVQKKDIPTPMKNSINSINNVRFLRLSHTALASAVNILNGGFQLLGTGLISSSPTFTTAGIKGSEDTAIPALALILTKNIYDFLSTTLDLVICQKNISALKEKKISHVQSSVSDLKTDITFHLYQKRKKLLYGTVSTGLVSSGMTVLLLGVTGQVPVQAAVSFFILTATPGQIIPIAKSCVTMFNLRKKKLVVVKEPESSHREDIGLIMEELARDLSSNVPASDFITTLQTGVFSSYLNLDQEKQNGLEGLSKVLF
ncbi:MAG: hypothetical protein K1000chlam2_01225 [Chlamydiae bacterium]|nr:hypothetical protein [Chlamydiota bacterium]